VETIGDRYVDGGKALPRGVSDAKGTPIVEQGVFGDKTSEKRQGGCMNVKGFIIEDEQGREFVLMCDQPYGRSVKTFSLRGWQRRRLVPLQYTERELRKIVGGVLATLNNLFRSLPRLLEHLDGASSGHATAAIPLTSKTSVLGKVTG
jgi:hypothetical protein